MLHINQCRVSLNNNQCGSDFQTNDRDILWLVETNTSVIHCCSRKLNNALHRFEFYFVFRYESDLRSTSSLEKHESKYFLFLLNISFCHCLYFNFVFNLAIPKTIDALTLWYCLKTLLYVQLFFFQTFPV